MTRSYSRIGLVRLLKPNKTDTLRQTKYGMKKPPTNPAVESLILDCKDFSEQKKKYYDIISEYGKRLAQAEYAVNVLKVAKDAFDHRKYAMDNLTKLLVSGFYSAKLPKDLKDEVLEEREKRLETRARESADQTIQRRRRATV